MYKLYFLVATAQLTCMCMFKMFLYSILIHRGWVADISINKGSYHPIAHPRGDLMAVILHKMFSVLYLDIMWYLTQNYIEICSQGSISKKSCWFI